MDRDLASQSSPLKSLAREYSFGTVSGCTWECVDQVWKVCAQYESADANAAFMNGMNTVEEYAYIHA